MVNQTMQPRALLFAIAFITLIGASFALLKNRNDFTVQARTHFQDEQLAGPVVWSQQDVYTGTLNANSDLPVAEAEAVTIGDFQLENKDDDVSSAGLISRQDILEEKGCVVNPGAGQVNVPLSAFRHAEESPASEFRFWTEGGYLYSTSATSMKLAAPVYLPDGVNLTHMALVFFDNRSATQVTARLIRKNLAAPGTAREQITGFFSTDSSSTKVLCASKSAPDFTVGTGAISNDYSYFAVLEFPTNPDLKLDQLVFVLKIYYEPPQVDSGVAVVPAAAFKHNGDNANNGLLNYDATAGFIRSTGPVTPTLVAPVYLPPGATLTKFRASVRDVDTTPGRNLTVQLRRVRHDTGVVKTIALLQTDDSPLQGAEGAKSILPNGDLEIVTADYSYYITFSLPSNPTDNDDILFFGARVFYMTP